MKAKKKYGQNFLTDNDLLEKIKSVINIDKNTDVVEIGPGRGYLTTMLVNNSKKLVCYEIDTDLINDLNNKFSNYKNFVLINDDFMKCNIEGNNIKVVANIPYYITSPIIQKLIENRDKIDEIYLMVQKEVANRICSDYGKKDISILTHSVRFYADATYLFTVDKTMFDPIPKVDSAFIRIKIKKHYENIIDENKYFNFLKLAFSSKRKTLINNLKSHYDKEKLQRLISNNVRAEDYSIDDFIELIKGLEND